MLDQATYTPRLKDEFRDRIRGNTAHNIALTAGLNFGF